MAHNEIPLFTKIWRFYDFIYRLNKKVPKRDRYSLGTKIENCLIDLLELIITASNSAKNEKIIFLKKANIKLEILKVLIRIMRQHNLMTAKKYLLLEGKLQEIGRMLGGWICWQKNR